MTRAPALALFALAAALLAGQGPSAAAGQKEATEAYNAGDYATALKEFLPLAEAGDAEAQTLVAGLYARGLGTPAAVDKAAEWYARAAEQRHPYATAMLGWFHLRGLGVAQDPVKGYRLLSRAAAQGQPEAMVMRAAVTDKAISGLDDLVAAEAKTHGIDLAQAYFRVAQTFAKGHGVPRLPEVAAEAFRRAAGRGHSVAQYELGRRLDAGDGVTEDPAQAFDWFKKAADQGHADAAAMIGRAYLLGRGVAADRLQAMVRLTWAKSAGSRVAEEILDGLDK